MNVLFLHTNESIKDDLQECVSDPEGNFYFTHNIEEVVAILHLYRIDIAFLELQRLADIRLLKYIRDHFPQVRMILSVENRLEDAISAIKSCQFSLLYQPFAVRKLKNILLDKNADKTRAYGNRREL
jgi:DNA-binding NtrC family response regulator